MAIFKFLKKILGKDHPSPNLEYIRDESAQSEIDHPSPHVSKDNLQAPGNEIDVTRQADLEGYARDINVSKESIERWISSGLLMPEELKVAEKLLKIMRRR